MRIASWLPLLIVFAILLASTVARADEATDLDAAAIKAYRAGHFEEALKIGLQVLDLREKTLGPENVVTARTLNGVGLVYFNLGRLKDAESCYQRALSIYAKVDVPPGFDTATAQMNLAQIYHNEARYDEAEKLFLEALALHEKIPNDVLLPTCLSNLSLVYIATARYPEAEKLLLRTLEETKKMSGADSAPVAFTLSNLASLYEHTSDYARAEKLYLQSLDICRRKLGAESLQTANVLNNLGIFYKNQGDYGKAAEMLQQALSIREKVLGPDTMPIASTLNNLATLYETLGQYTRAESLYLRSLKIRYEVLPPDHPDIATACNNLGNLYFQMDRWQDASNYYLKALSSQQRSLGPDSIAVAVTLNNLATMFDAGNQPEQALPLLEKALAIREKTSGPDHPETARLLHNIGQVRQKMKDFSGAEPYFQRALAIYRKLFGDSSRDTAATLAALAYLKLEQKQIAEARRYGHEWLAVEEKVLARVLSFTSEQQRLDYQKEDEPYSVVTSLGDPADIARSVLHHKGIVLDSILEDIQLAEAAHRPEQQQMVDHLRGLKLRLESLLSQTPTASDEATLRKRDQAIADLQAQIEDTQGRLARFVTSLGHTRRSLSVTVADVPSHLPADAVLVEYVHCRYFSDRFLHEEHYGAVVIAPHGAPQWIPLGTSEQIEEMVSLYHRLVSDGELGRDMSFALRKLYDAVWQPVRTRLPAGVKIAIMSPDGELNFISFATLLDEQSRFLGETTEIRYVASGRDLLQPARKDPPRSMVLIGNPDFSRNSQAVGQPTSRVRGVDLSRDNIVFAPLPGTALECNTLEKIAEQWHWNVHAYMGQDATKSRVMGVQSPGILHLATHGFFLSPSSEGGTKHADNPMRRSGVALAGAQATVRAQREGRTPTEDGILTAEQVGTLHLEGTSLVTLSACESGRGEARAGEGVLGLRRGFIYAGTRNLLMTLWPVSDRETALFMADFYRAAHDGNPARALAHVQRDWLVRLRKQMGVTRAVQLIGPFILTFQGPP